jgi:integrase
MASVSRRGTKKGKSRYDVRYWTPDGKQRSEVFSTRRAAEARASEIEADQQRGAWIDPRFARRSFDTVAMEWLASNPAKRPSAWARDESIVRVHLDPALGDEPIGKVTPARVRALVTAWSDVFEPRTVRRMYGVLRAIFAFAVESTYLMASPCRGVKLPAVEPITCHVITAEELEGLAHALGPSYAAMPYLGAMLGLRWGEVAGLKVGRVDVLAGTVTVAEQVTRGPQGVSVFGPPKSTAGRRTLTMPKSLSEMLAAHLSLRGLTAAHATELLFTAADGDLLDYANFRHRIWQPACAKVGIGRIVKDAETGRRRYEGLTFHDLRRANATALVLAGVDLKTAQTRLGHSDPRLTLGVYAQATTDADEAAAVALDERFSRRLCERHANESA